DRGLLGHDPAGLGAAGGGGDPGVLLDPVDPLDDHPVLLGQRRDHLALGALVLAGDDEDRVALLHLHQTLTSSTEPVVAAAGVPRTVACTFIGYRTSGAREMIRMNLFSRSSRPTGPKMRVPRGSLSFLISTAAFSSKRM